MSKKYNLGWSTDRKDLVAAVSKLPMKAAERLVAAHMRGDPRIVGLRAMRHEQKANLLMIGLLEGLVPESAVIPCAP